MYKFIYELKKNYSNVSLHKITGGLDVTRNDGSWLSPVCLPPFEQKEILSYRKKKGPTNFTWLNKSKRFFSHFTPKKVEFQD